MVIGSIVNQLYKLCSELWSVEGFKVINTMVLI
jgi:hypothetical protein